MHIAHRGVAFGLQILHIGYCINILNQTTTYFLFSFLKGIFLLKFLITLLDQSPLYTENIVLIKYNKDFSS